MTLGSSIGNFERKDAPDFLGGFARALGPKDSILVGVDNCQDKERIFHAYNDRHGTTEKFYRNGVAQANKLLGEEVFNQDIWDVIGEYDEATGRHQAFISPKKSVACNGFHFPAGERIRIENAYKYSPEQKAKLWQDSGLSLSSAYLDSSGQYCKCRKGSRPCNDKFIPQTVSRRLPHPEISVREYVCFLIFTSLSNGEAMRLQGSVTRA